MFFARTVVSTGIDLAKEDVFVEVQFSNYPFLLNNILRAEVLHRNNCAMHDKYPVNILILIAKVRRLPAANSSLYYEQAVSHIKQLVKLDILQIPLRIVGLDTPTGRITADITTYADSRYSRIPIKTETIKVNANLVSGHSKSRLRITK